MTEQLLVQAQDPEVMQVLQGVGVMPPALEIQVISGTLADTAPVVVSEEQQRQQAIAEWCEAHPAVDQEESVAQLNRQVQGRMAAAEMARQESIEVAQRVMAAQGRAARGW